MEELGTCIERRFSVGGLFFQKIDNIIILGVEKLYFA